MFVVPAASAARLEPAKGEYHAHVYSRVLIHASLLTHSASTTSSCFVYSALGILIAIETIEYIDSKKRRRKVFILPK